MIRLTILFALLFLSCDSPKDCDYIIPEGYSLLYNQERKDYVVKCPEEGSLKELYLVYYGRIKEYGTMPPVVNYTTFTDSCEAKYHIKQYMKIPNINNYKPIE